MAASCPFCNLTVPSSQLERHANSHFEAEDYDQLAKDLEFAQQLAFAPSSPPSMSNQTFARGDGQCSVEESISCLVALQTRTTFHEIEGGVMAMLRECLELEPRNTTSILCGYTDHVQSIRSEDSGWGCGWRNIQMLSSHLLTQRLESRDSRSFVWRYVRCRIRFPSLHHSKDGLRLLGKSDFDAVGSIHPNSPPNYTRLYSYVCIHF